MTDNLSEASLRFRLGAIIRNRFSSWPLAIADTAQISFPLVGSIIHELSRTLAGSRRGDGSDTRSDRRRGSTPHVWRRRQLFVSTV